MRPFGQGFQQRTVQRAPRQADVREQLHPALRGKRVGTSPPAERDGGIGGNVQLTRYAGVCIHAGGNVHSQNLHAPQPCNHVCEFPAQPAGSADAGDAVDGKGVLRGTFRQPFQHGAAGVGER